MCTLIICLLNSLVLTVQSWLSELSLKKQNKYHTNEATIRLVKLVNKQLKQGTTLSATKSISRDADYGITTKSITTQTILALVKLTHETCLHYWKNQLSKPKRWMLTPQIKVFFVNYFQEALSIRQTEYRWNVFPKVDLFAWYLTPFDEKESSYSPSVPQILFSLPCVS